MQGDESMFARADAGVWVGERAPKAIWKGGYQQSLGTSQS